MSVFRLFSPILKLTPYVILIASHSKNSISYSEAADALDLCFDLCSLSLHDVSFKNMLIMIFAQITGTGINLNYLKTKEKTLFKKLWTKKTSSLLFLDSICIVKTVRQNTFCKTAIDEFVNIWIKYC